MTCLHLCLWFLRPYYKIALFLIGFFALNILVETMAIGSIYPLLSSIINGQTADTNQIGIVLKYTNAILPLIPIDDKMIASCILLLVLTACGAVLAYACDFLTRFYHLKFNEIYMNKLFNIISRKQYQYFLDKKQGEIIYIGNNASLAMGEMFFYLPKTVVELLRVIIITAFLLTISVQATVVLFMLMGMAGYGYQFLSSRILYPIAVKIQIENENQLSIFSEVVAGIKEIKVFNATAFFFKRYRKCNHNVRNLSMKSAALEFIPTHLGKSVGIIIICTAIIYLKIWNTAVFIKMLPILAIYIVALQKLLPSISLIGSQWIGLKKLTPRLELLKYTLENDVVIESNLPDCLKIKEKLQINNLNFSYPGKKDVLKNLAIDIPAKSTIAFVGHSGSGKSTLINILAGLFEPSEGQIKIDNRNVDEFDKNSWLSKISVVTQEPFLFHASVLDNIRLGNSEASDEEIEEAAKQANAHSFILTLENGYHTVLGDRGAKLSGGQKQRVAIARALLRKPEVLLLDEATSALDNLSEQAIKKALSNIQGKMITIIVAHRLTTIENVDNIYVLDQGNIVESGSHDELLQLRKRYYELYNIPSSS